MRNATTRMLMLGAGVVFGYLIYRSMPQTVTALPAAGGELRVMVGAMTGGGLVGFAVAPMLSRFGSWIGRHIDSRIRKVSTHGVISGAVGMIVGLIIANLLVIPVASIPELGSYVGIALNVFFAVSGLIVGYHKREEVIPILAPLPRSAEHVRLGAGARDRAASKAYVGKARPKILDTSVIIDGRIADIADSGFIEGTLIVPVFVLEELQHIADSSDVLKRNRGRRGLDILNRMQKDENVTVQIVDKTFDDQEVDSKLIRLAQAMDATILTNDFNLNKVAELHGVDVLNINELANALKPVVLPGEEMTVHVIKDGKESGQGVAYLDDGTMVVVDGGRRYIGDYVDVLVTSVLQTSAGRMIFAKMKSAERVG
ncbi:MAG: TRAM domain-containing protein [Firmicutes bacterium]|nr:TRAM domain-containing protein [Bacillota bacterium]MDD4337183.1 TRAM domain-containing protein [Bacillota bacterium]MDD4793104.1 TRAM domain-containing protein [Bacillota bacterium]